MRRILSVGLVLACPLFVVGAAYGNSSSAISTAADLKVAKLQLAFEANVGQAAGDVKFAARGPGYQLLLTPDERIMRLKGMSQAASATLRFMFEGSAPSRTVVGSEPMQLKTSYLFGGPSAESFVNIANFARVTYRSLYKGIDLVYYGNNEQLEYDFIVAPAANVSAIRMRVDGADSLQVSRAGELLIGTAAGTLVHRKPVAWQLLRGRQVPVDVSYALSDDRRVASLVAGRYDKSRTLIIDPIIAFSARVHSDNNGLAVDNSGNAYLSGTTSSANLPSGSTGYQTSYAGVSAAYLLKLNPLGTKALYATYFGVRGASVSSSGVVVDKLGNAYLYGRTDSASLPVTSGAYRTTKTGTAPVSFLTKFNATGSALVYSTFLPDVTPRSVAVDSGGNIYLAGQNAGMPTTPGAYQTNGGTSTFVAKLNAAGSAVVYATFINDTKASAIAVDQAGNAYVTGTTAATAFQTLNAFQPVLKGSTDAFVAKLNATGTALVYGTFLGGSAADQGNGIAVNPDGVAVVVGKTISEDFPVSSGAYQTGKGYPGYAVSNGFVSKLRADGALAYSTYLGGTWCTGCAGYADEDAAVNVAVDGAGQAYVAGYAGSGGFPHVDSVQLPPTANLGSDWHAPFISKLNTSGTELLYSMLIGPRSQWGKSSTSVALDGNGNAYVTGSSGFQATAGSLSLSSSTMLVKLAPPNVLVTLASSLNPAPPRTAVTITAKVQSPQSGGTITFMDNGVAIATANVVDGLAAVQFSPETGIHKITAVFSLDGKTTPPLYQLVNAK